jgi:hypothetical protein
MGAVPGDWRLTEIHAGLAAPLATKHGSFHPPLRPVL